MGTPARERAQGEGDQTIWLYLAHVERTECCIALTLPLSREGEGVNG